MCKEGVSYCKAAKALLYNNLPFHKVSDISFCRLYDGFGDIMFCMLASGTRVRGLKPGRSRWIFRTSEKFSSSTCLPSEGKWKNLSHVPALRHVKEPSASVNYECASKIPCIVPSFAGRGLSYLCGAWRLWRWMRGTHWGKGTIGLQAAVPKRPHTRPLI
jgi:hypothetical protein